MAKMLASDAAASDVLIVVVGSLSHRRPELMDWLATLPPVLPLRHGLLIGLLGDEEARGQELDWTAKQLIRCARENNRRFVWHWMGHHDGDVSEWLGESVEALVASRRPMDDAMITRNPASVWQAA